MTKPKVVESPPMHNEKHAPVAVSVDNCPLELECAFAILDVKSGREALGAVLKRRRVRVIMEAVIDFPWGVDDGESVEFGADVTSIKIISTEARK